MRILKSEIKLQKSGNKEKIVSENRKVLFYEFQIYLQLFRLFRLFFQLLGSLSKSGFFFVQQTLKTD